MAPVARGLHMDVVVGNGAPSLAVLGDLAAENPGLHLHVDTLDMAALTAAADVGIGAGGSSVWERACVGLPSVSLILTDNQGPMAMDLDRAGALFALDARDADMANAVASAGSRLIEDSALRARLSTTSSSLCDGAGAERVASAILAGVV
jgi:spore coat polysaccharide biosynthesis predicted glycosyltransferase SpsG